MKNLFRSMPLVAALLVGPTLLVAPSLVEAQVNVAFAPSVRVQVAPPPMRVEVRPLAPSPAHIWAGGAWRWQGGRHEWAPGRWEAPQPGNVWVDPHWRHEHGQWGYYEGRWVPCQQPYHREIIIATPPPPPEEEVVPAMHEPRHEWIHGHWEWQGERHIWLPGRYEERPEHLRWEDHRWERTEDNRYRFQRGGWRRYQEERR